MLFHGSKNLSRSREGAWIEIKYGFDTDSSMVVAPVRERGLKFLRWSGFGLMAISRSREGAWIEISFSFRPALSMTSRSREGAWIEIYAKARSYRAANWSLP